MTAAPHSHYLFNVLAIEKQAMVSNHIFSEHRVLLLRSGTVIEAKHAYQLTGHKLLRPIELDLQLEASLSANELFEQLSNLVEKYSDFSEIEKRQQALPLISTFCPGFIKQEILQQKLTVMAKALPELYLKSLFCGWFAVCVGQEKGFNTQQLQQLFYAGLLHDFGMLDMPRSYAQMGFEYNSQQRRQMQTHPIVAYSNLQQVPDLSHEVLKSVLEHHERIDGSGYPHGLSLDRLTCSGQMIALCDAFYLVRFSEYYGRPLSSLSQALPILQVSSDLFMPEVCELLMNVITASCQEKLRFEHIDSHFYNLLLKQIEGLRLKSTLTKSLLLHLKKTNAYEREYQSAISSADYFVKTTARAGVEFGSLSAWICSLRDSQELVCQEEQIVIENLEILLEELNHLYARMRQKIKLLPQANLIKFLDQKPN